MERRHAGPVELLFPAERRQHLCLARCCRKHHANASLIPEPGAHLICNRSGGLLPHSCPGFRDMHAEPFELKTLHDVHLHLRRITVPLASS